MEIEKRAETRTIQRSVDLKSSLIVVPIENSSIEKRLTFEKDFIHPRKNSKDSL